MEALNKKDLRNAAITGAPQALQIGDATFLVGPPSREDQVALAGWVMRTALAAKTKVKPVPPEMLEGLSGEERMMVIRMHFEGAEAARSKTVGQEELAEILTSAAGVAIMVFFAARRFDPTVKLADVQKLVTEENAIDVFVRFNEATTTRPAPESVDTEKGRKLLEDAGTGLGN